MVINNKKEILVTRAAIVFSFIIFSMLMHSLYAQAVIAYASGNKMHVFEGMMFGAALCLIMYSTVLYKVCRIGHYKRQHKHMAVSRDELEVVYDTPDAATLTVLIPSYKEERSVIWQTMMSAALVEYPAKNIVLLIDDPYPPHVLEDIVKVETSRKIPLEFQALFDTHAEIYRAALQGFEQRCKQAFYPAVELSRLSVHYNEVAQWLEAMAETFKAGRDISELNYAEQFFITSVLDKPASAHRAFADALLERIVNAEVTDIAYIHRHYKRLVGLFTINFSSFERKKYTNLSHEANKAMNLNSYLSLMGKAWEEVEVKGGWELRETTPAEADFVVPYTDFVNTIDADSLTVSDYALRLIHIMQQPANANVAVIQSPCSAFPGCPSGLERVAGAGIDVQFLAHQGFSHWGASFWVGANALLRRCAMEDIKEVRHVNGHDITIYIKDSTVIEDTESSIAFVQKGWKLYNYPERMTFSATPPDFGSLLIQRRRWANGGMIILPTLLRYIAQSPKNMALFKEVFMRYHNLAATTTSCFVSLLFLLYPFENVLSTPVLPLLILPLVLLYARDLKNSGYRYRDMFGICAMNLMLVPVHTGGVLKQFQQMITGQKIPFGRTPKVTGRTAVPVLYCVVEVALLALFGHMTLSALVEQHFLEAAFSAINAVLMFYVVVHYIGVKAIIEDITALPRARWKALFHTAEIIPFPARWIPRARPARRKRA